MPEIALKGSRAKRGGRSFYLLMSLVLAAIVTFGFSHTVPSDLAPPGLPALLKMHAAVFVLWVLLFVAQPAFVVAGSLSLHRGLGWFGTGLAAAMVTMGTLVILLALRADSLPPFYPRGLFLVRGILGLAVFAGLVTAGIIRRRQGEWHKRLMLCASIVVVVPGLERALPVPITGPDWPFVIDGLIDLIALVGPARDFVTQGRVHPAYYWGVGTLVGGQALVDLLSPSPLVTFLLRAV